MQSDVAARFRFWATNRLYEYIQKGFAMNDDRLKQSGNRYFKELSEIHKYLFDDIYYFAGKIRNDNIAKGNFRFVSAIYLEEILSKIDEMSQKSFEEIIKNP